MSKAAEEETEIVTTSISMESSLLESGKAAADKQRRSFSAYVSTLIEADLAANAAGDLTKKGKR